MSLLQEIIRCQNIKNCLEQSLGDHACHEIVRSQSKDVEEFQVPEPWSGHLKTAPILFVGSNPSISDMEDYPRWKWSDEQIADFFVNRFEGGQKAWTKDGLYVLCQDGAYGGGWVRDWAAVRQRAVELLGNSQVSAGTDYVLTEVVHCKSGRELGVRAATAECAKDYLSRIVAESGAKVIVSLGKVAGWAVRHSFALPDSVRIFGPVVVDKQHSIVL